MRHKVYGKHLSRNTNARSALFKNLVRSLIISESIQTTESKAKAVKGLVDKVITAAKSPQTRRLVASLLIDKAIQDKLIKELMPRLKDRNSGYTRLIKLGRRLGDGAMIVKMELLLSEEKKSAPVKKESIRAKKGLSK